MLLRCIFKGWVYRYLIMLAMGIRKNEVLTSRIQQQVSRHNNLGDIGKSIGSRKVAPARKIIIQRVGPNAALSQNALLISGTSCRHGVDVQYHPVCFQKPAPLLALSFKVARPQFGLTQMHRYLPSRHRFANLSSSNPAAPSVLCPCSF